MLLDSNNPAFAARFPDNEIEALTVAKSTCLIGRFNSDC